MKKMQVTAEVPERKDAEGNIKQVALGPVTVEVSYPETFKEAQTWCGEEAMLTNGFGNWRVTLQSNIRSALKRGEKPEDIASRLSSAVMGVASTGGHVDVEAAFAAKFLAANEKERAAMLEKLKAAATD